MKSFFILLLTAVFLAGCEESIVSHARYSCAGNMNLDASFRDGKELRITAEGQVFILERVVSPSGAKYASGETEFWSKGKDAVFTTSKGAVNCQRR